MSPPKMMQNISSEISKNETKQTLRKEIYEMRKFLDGLNYKY